MAHAGPFMLRIAGLPVAEVHRLRCPGSARWADEVLAREAALRERGAALSDLLHDLIGSNDDGPARRRLLALRRQVFGNALPPDPGAAVSLVSTLDPSVAVALAGWLADRRGLADLVASGADLVAAELGASRDALRALATEPPLALGLPLASPALAGQIGQLPGAGTPRPDKRARRVERSVVSYLYRTACKTSPFSTFTGVGLGAAADGGTAAVATVGDHWVSQVRLNVVVLGRLAEAVAADVGRRGDLPVALASGRRDEDERVRYVRRWVRTGDDTASVSFDAAREHLFFLRRSGLLDRLIALLGTTPMRCGQVVAWLAAQEAADPAECQRYLSTLLDLGMLRLPCFDIDVHAADPLRALRDTLAGLDRPWATRLAVRLATPLAAVDAYPAADPATRRGLLADLRAELTQIMQQLGVPQPVLPQVLLYEDASVGDRCAVDPTPWLRLVGAELRAVERLLPAFDPTHVHRIIFKGFFLARFGPGGRCDDVLKLVADFHEDFYDQYVSFTADRRPFDEHGEYVPEENWMALPAIEALDDARRGFVDHMRQTWRETLHDVAGADRPAEIQLDPRIVEQTAALVAPAAAPVLAHSHFLQLAADDNDPLVVLNQTYGGLSFAFSRFTHCFDGLAGQLRRGNAAIAPDGAVLAEITGGAATTNLNLHGRLTDYEIVTPGEHSCVPADRQLPMDDLAIVHLAAEDRLALWSRRLGREVLPCYFGYLIPTALPEVTRTLLLLAPTAMGRVDVWGGVPAGEPTDGVTTRPRVRLGSLVLSRRSWQLAAADLPGGALAAGGHEWWLAWRRWWRGHGLPRQVFATVHPTGAGDGRPAKPQYVDVDSVLSLTALAGMVTGGDDTIVLREMLPRDDQLHVTSSRGAHVAELVVQTHRRTG